MPADFYDSVMCDDSGVEIDAEKNILGSNPK
jgi:hypothetical protein